MIENANIEPLIEAARYLGVSLPIGYLGTRGLWVLLDHVFKDADNPKFKEILKERPTSIEPFSVDGHIVHGLGVNHVAETFINNESDIRERVNKSDFIVLEGFGKAVQGIALPTTSNNQLLETKKKNYHMYAGSFFAGIGKVCAEERKDIFVANPQSPLNLNIDFSLLLGTPAYLGIMNMLQVGSGSEVEVMRRAMVVGSLSVWMSWLRMSRELRDSLEFVHLLPEDPLPREERADFLGYGFNDYRDVRTALGIRRILNLWGSEISEGSSLFFVQGEHHNGVAEYLKRPKLANIKKFVYPHYHFTGDRAIRRYSFNPSENKWSLTQRVPF
jgi:hypothetical protein